MSSYVYKNTLILICMEQSVDFADNKLLNTKILRKR